MKLIQSRLENIIKRKVIKKHNTLPVQKLKYINQSGKNSVPGSLQNFSPNPGTCLVQNKTSYSCCGFLKIQPFKTELMTSCIKTMENMVITSGEKILSRLYKEKLFTPPALISSYYTHLFLCRPSSLLSVSTFYGVFESLIYTQLPLNRDTRGI